MIARPGVLLASRSVAISSWSKPVGHHCAAVICYKRLIAAMASLQSEVELQRCNVFKPHLAEELPAGHQQVAWLNPSALP